MTDAACQFWVGGDPRTQGSFIARTVKGRTYVVPQDDAKLKRWRKSVAAVARGAWADSPYAGRLLDGSAVRLRLQFVFVPPASDPHRPYPVTRSSGDLDKLQRAVLDALTGVIYQDDSQVVSVTASKIYRAASPGVLVAVGAADTTMTLPA
jgi:crossover junction endodeoxyribonuclease RusA